MVFLLIALAYGSMFVFSGVVLLVHQWLVWWMAFGITGIVIVIAEFGFQTIMARRAAVAFDHSTASAFWWRRRLPRVSRRLTMAEVG
jgi:O-antigen/teichoic acid export membrane protein